MIIVFEGIHGCGKTTQLNNLYNWLQKAMNTPIIKTSWNSYPVLQQLNNDLKKERKLTPDVSYLIHALDFTLRYEQDVLGVTKNNGIALFDRYTYTAYVRDSLRGISTNVLDEIYHWAPEPDLIFLFDIDPRIAVKRVGNLAKRSWYILGRDVIQDEDTEAGFTKFLELQRSKYLELLKNNSKVRIINAEEPEDTQFESIMEELLKAL